MDDQLESPLERFYAGVAASVRRRVSSAYPLETCLSTSADYPEPRGHFREVWRITVPLLGEERELLLAIPNTFPDELPVAYLPVDPTSRPIPHLDYKRLLCTFDGSVTAPNSDKPVEIALAVIGRACQVWQSGLTETNVEDYADEFSAYWAQDVALQCLSIVEIDGRPREVVEIMVSPPWKVFESIFADTEDEGKKWLDAVGCDSKTATRKALYLSLEDFGRPPYPATNGELYGFLHQHAPECLERLLNFLRRRTARPSPILFSVKSGSGRAVGAWRHPNFMARFQTSGPGGFRSVRGIRGFRPNAHPIALELNGLNRHARLEKIVVSRADAARLTERTLGEAAESRDKPINVVGCGSLGGFIAEGMARAGNLKKMRLVDPEVLTPENTLRHCCSMSDIRQLKVEAVAHKIRRAFPATACESFAYDVLNLIRLQPNCLADGGITVVAIGNLAAERRLNVLSRGTGCPLTRYVCFTWVEPYLYGGHALLLRADKPGCFECLLDENLLFRHGIVLNPGKYLKREAGCQSSYTPYGAAELTGFASLVTRWLLDYNEADAPMLLSWTGDLSQAVRQGVEVTAEYTGMAPFSQRLRSVTPNPDCRVCGHA